MQTASKPMDRDLSKASPADMLARAMDGMRAHKQDSLPACCAKRLPGIILESKAGPFPGPILRRIPAESQSRALPWPRGKVRF